MGIVTPRAGIGGRRTILRKHEQPQRGRKVAVPPFFIDLRDEPMKRHPSLGSN